ncbi:hypothetical protein MUK42_14832 [Musa troglodytarum]|uniref:Uncharacterized protein n=1 Tax=Musa troglodytarum TaxID=320322 RepID=A0A9E7I2A1_9LILI|nr:hypothetical protein MUK42_14832 [Musa troglodytarum]
MAKERREGEACLPSDFLCDDHFLEEKRRRDDCFLEEFAMNLDWPAEDECLHMTGLAWQMPGSFLGDTQCCDRKYGITAGSPGTALRGWFISEKKGSLDAPSLVALPPALPFSDHCETADSGHCTSPVPIHLQRFQATQLKQQQQLMRQQVFAAWARQSEARGGVNSHNRGRPMGQSPSARRPRQMQQQQPQPGSGMRAVFLSSPSARRESAGTGVFLPRIGGDKSESPKKPDYSTVLVPERVAQALNLNPEEMGGKPYFVPDHDALMSRRDAALSHRKRNDRPRHPTPPAIREIRLPQEWTY